MINTVYELKSASTVIVAYYLTGDITTLGVPTERNEGDASLALKFHDTGTMSVARLYSHDNSTWVEPTGVTNQILSTVISAVTATNSLVKLASDGLPEHFAPYTAFKLIPHRSGTTVSVWYIQPEY